MIETRNGSRLVPILWAWTFMLALLTLPAMAAATVAELDAATRSKIDNWLKTVYPADEPGATVLVAHGQEVLFRGAYGMANLELGVPLKPDMVLRLGSITKQFTAASIMMLAEEGKLAVSDPITQHLPDYPVHGHTITIEHLLNHTSGIFSYTAIPGYMNGKIRDDLTTEELVDVFKNLPMDFAPGDRWRYNNSGYVLLGAIIEAVSGKSYPDFVAEKIFEQLGMSNSHYGGGKLIPRRVAGYSGRSGNYSNAAFLSMTQPQAAGSLLSNVDDLLRWNSALVLGDVISAASYQQMTQKARLNDGELVDYGYGFRLAAVRGKSSVEHGGGIFGFSTFGIWIPEQQIYAAVLTNIPGRQPSPGLVAKKLVAHAMGDPYREFEVQTLPAAILKRYEGVYKVGEEQQRILSVRDGKLYSQRTGGPQQEVSAANQTTFFYPNSLSYFEMIVDSSGQVSGMKMFQNGEPDAEIAKWISSEIPKPEVAEVDPSILADYVGVYQLAPSVTVTVSHQDDRLYVQVTGQPRAEIFPTSETEFFLQVVDAQISFVREGDGTISQLILHQGGRDVPAKKIQN